MITLPIHHNKMKYIMVMIPIYTYELGQFLYVKSSAKGYL